ncbi:MAG TPA: glycosyltransferase N-terminal domain-containing protein [Gemmatimonadaceae bacterium]|nr:glycosyltransferase N-terminal domain-containing protein [Gemmatimonadaceae bacterium]
MNPLARIPYFAAGAVARALAAIPPPGNSKASRALRARRGIRHRYAEWAAESRDPSKPLLWVHAPSVGEGLQALPVIQLFRAAHPGAQIAYTFFSPSAERFAATVGADFHDYLPFDTVGDAALALSALRPTALVFSKLDVWPVLVEQAASRGARLGLMSAAMPASSGRRARAAQLFLRDAFHAMDLVGAVSDSDGANLIGAGVRPDRLRITGDARYDQAWSKAESNSAERAALIGPLRAARFTLVAGSTWPSDELRLLPAWLAVRRALPSVRLIIAPHELSSGHLESVETWALSSGLEYARTGDPAASSADVIVVDRYGILGDLYALADVAYVGGGFRDAGLHSLLEPAAFGAPVIIGPGHADNRDASLLVAAGGAFRCSDSAAITSRMRRWLENPESLTRARTAAREVVQSGLGAADRSVEIVESLMR